MSGSIGRQYLIQSWNNASEYSGEMIGNRQKQSTQIYLPNGKANLAMFADEKTQPTKKKTGGKTLTAYETIVKEDREFDKLEQLSLALDKQYLNLEIDDEEYDIAKNIIEEKMVRAWVKLCKVKGWTQEEEEQEQPIKKSYWSRWFNRKQK